MQQPIAIVLFLELCSSGVEVLPSACEALSSSVSQNIEEVELGVITKSQYPVVPSTEDSDETLAIQLIKPRGRFCRPYIITRTLGSRGKIEMPT